MNITGLGEIAIQGEQSLGPHRRSFTGAQLKIPSASYLEIETLQ
jgi:hypothetical protein